MSSPSLTRAAGPCLTVTACADEEHTHGKAVRTFYLAASGQAYALSSAAILGCTPQNFELQVALEGEPLGDSLVRLPAALSGASSSLICPLGSTMPC